MKKLNQIISGVLRMKEEELKDGLTMQDLESWDSLKHMDLITSIEKDFDIQFSMDEILIMIDIKTIKKIVNEKLL
jgi:acyl carrier protein